MKTALWMMVGIGLFSNGVWAKSDQAILAEAKANVVTIAQAHKLKDETGVTLNAHVVRQLSKDSDEFEIKDKTGSIVIDVDDDDWKRLQLKAGDKVRVIGEVDTHRSKPTDIDVIQIQRVK
jgi:uncharacterized protein (TIGR00156 family)